MAVVYNIGPIIKYKNSLNSIFFKFLISNFPLACYLKTAKHNKITRPVLLFMLVKCINHSLRTTP